MIDYLSAVKGEYSINLIIQTLKKFKEEHVRDYEEARKEYLNQFELGLKKALKEFRKGQVPQISNGLGLTAPKLCAEEYDNIISAFEMMNDPLKPITLSLDEANCIFNDKWQWVAGAKAINATYSNFRR